MRRIEITVPNMNDSFSRVTLDSRQYFIRFTYNSTADRWSFGLYSPLKTPIVVGIRMVPRFPLNMQIVDDNFPNGIFGVYSKKESIGRRDFIDGNAIFAYIPAGQ